MTPQSLHSPEALLRALAGLVPSPTGLYLHVDLDVLDIDAARVNIYGAPGGPSAEELESIVGAVVARHPVRAISLTAYDPQCDVEDAVPAVALRLLESITEHVRRSAG